MSDARRALPIASIALASLAFPKSASANAGRHHFDGDDAAAVGPYDDAATVRIDHESLLYDVRPSRDVADVTARYRLVETGAGSELDLAFAYVMGEGRRGPPPVVTLDGAQLEAVETTEEEVLKRRLDAYLDVHDDIARTLEELRALPLHEQTPLDESVAARVKALGGDCRGWCVALRGYVDHARAQGDVLPAAREAIPAEVEAFRARWAGDRERWVGPIRFTRFHVSTSAGAARDLEVRFTQTASRSIGERVHPSFGFDYLLEPARRWKSYGRLDVEVHLPRSTRVDAAFSSGELVPLRADGDVLRASFASLPSSRIAFDLRSSEDLWFGLEKPADYWWIAAGASILATLGASASLGVRWARVRRGWARGLLHSIASSAVGIATSLLVTIVLSFTMPAGAFGGYLVVLLGLVALSFASAPVAVASSVVTAAVVRRKRAKRQLVRRLLASPRPSAPPSS